MRVPSEDAAVSVTRYIGFSDESQYSGQLVAGVTRRGFNECCGEGRWYRFPSDGEAIHKQAQLPPIPAFHDRETLAGHVPTQQCH